MFPKQCHSNSALARCSPHCLVFGGCRTGLVGEAGREGTASPWSPHDHPWPGTPGLSCALTLCKTNQFLFFVSSQADEYFALTWLLTNFCTWPLWEMWKLFFFFSWYDTPSSTVRGVDYKYTKLMQNIIAKKLSLSRVSS